MIKLAARIKKVSPSSTLQITARAKALKKSGKDVVNFAAGEPDFDTPCFIKDAAIEAIKEGFTKYTPSTGMISLKEAIAEKFRKENGLEYQIDQIAVSSGAKHSIYSVLQVLIDSKDEVLIPLPYWVSYPEMVKLAGGTPKFIKTRSESNFKLDSSELNKNITPRTKLLILNSPSNPVGCVYSKEELEAIAGICVKRNIFVLSDEIYEKIIYDGKQHFSIGALNNKIRDLTITINGVSKSFSMTGWRIGYLGAALEITAAVKKLQDHSTSNPSSISQRAALSALTVSDDWIDKSRDEFRVRRDYLIKRMSKIGQLSFITPEGAFYLFCNISKTKMGSIDFSNKLLEDFLVATIPGVGFGRDDFIRMSFATSLQEITKGMDRIEEFLKKLK